MKPSRVPPSSSPNQFFDPSAESNALMAKHAAGKFGGKGDALGSEVSLEQLLKVSDEPKVTKEEENTFIMQVRDGETDRKCG